MERDPRGGEAKKASPVHYPSDSVIDELLWTTYGINPRRQMVVPAMGDGGGGGGGVGKFSINGVGGVGSGGGVDCSTEKWRDWRYIEDDQEREAAKASSKEAMEKQHAKANDGMKDDLCKRLSKHFTAQAAKKQNPAEK